MNCSKLECITIGRFSFADYSGGFEVTNLPRLFDIEIGVIDVDYSKQNDKGWTVNFYFSSFAISSFNIAICKR